MKKYEFAMMKKNKLYNFWWPVILGSLFLFSCVQGPKSTRAKSLSNAQLKNGRGGTIIGGGIGAVDDSTATSNTSTIMTQKVELTHLVDPFDGTYKKKVTIPKNYKGNFYLAGLNISALVDKLIQVRFTFGVDRQSVTLNATVARAPGIIPKTDIQVLAIDMNSKPFSKMRLGYDLYDYNDYITDPTKEIVSDPKNSGLYCRGLRLEDDPTYLPLITNTSSCTLATDKCLYAYAKVVDSTLYANQVINLITYTISSIPSRPEVWTVVDSTRSPTVSSFQTAACLPDNNDLSTLQEMFNLTNVTLPVFPTYNAAFMTDYIYRGPYRAINESEWQLSSEAVYNTSNFGLFQTKFTNSPTGFVSLLFPRAGKMNLNQGVYYLGSSDHFGIRTSTVSDATGTTNYVDGCNLRVLNYDPSSNESIGSCNINAGIEIFYMLDGKEQIITTDKSIKLQLIRASLQNYEGKEVLSTSFKRCENSNTCGAEECCFNSRCWSKELVTQCLDLTPVVGNQEIGANCTSDFECSSLCCNLSIGACAPHNPNGTSPVSCNKSSGQQCVSKEFCQQEAVATCKVIKSGFKLDGTVACTLRCPSEMTYGECKNGACIPPTQPAIPVFDPVNCTGAVDP